MMQFQQLQQEFIAHIKDPEQAVVPEGIEARRMAIYRNLFFNNIEGFLASAYPVLKSLYQPEDWLILVRSFFRSYNCTSPYFLHIAEHFLDFLQGDYQLADTDPPFLFELAHYEWAELYLATKQTEEDVAPVRLETLEATSLQLSPISMVLAYQYPVHQISAENRPARSEAPFFYLLYRNEQDDVKFILLNQVTAALLHIIHDTPGLTLQQALEKLMPMLPQFNQEQIYSGAVSLLGEFAVKGILQAFQNP